MSVKEKDGLIRKNSFFDEVSLSPFWLPPLVFIPTIVYFLYEGYFLVSAEKWIIGVTYGLVGFFLWTLTEYLLHRFVFHYKPTSHFGKKIIYLLHGAHHDAPNDLKRLVFPVTVSIPLAAGVFYLFELYHWSNSGYHYICFATFILGYLCYDMIHYASHAVNSNNKFFGRMKKNHMTHHFQNPNGSFGVSSRLWDKIFGTVQRK